MKMKYILYNFIFFLLITCCLSAQESSKDTYQIQYQYPFTDGIPKETYCERRIRTNKSMSAKSFALVLSAEFYDTFCGSDIWSYKNSNLLYLTGFPPRKAVLLLVPGGVEVEGHIYIEMAFLEKQSDHSLIWNGAELGANYAESELGIEKVFDFSQFVQVLDKLISSRDTLFLADFSGEKEHWTPSQSDDEPQYPDAINNYFKKNPDLIIKNSILILKEMREIKDELELNLLQKAIDITIQGHLEAMRSAKPGIAEYELQAAMEFVFKRLGAETVGYPSIVGSGSNSCTIHYEKNRAMTKDGDLVLMDCGAEYHGYTADITRTFPINGKFSKEQKVIYDFVLEAQDSAKAGCLAGKSFMEPHLRATRIIQKKLLELGIIKNESESGKYFPHGTSHYLGLDVHDPGSFGELQPGMVITVEPGIYIPPGSPCDKKWWGIGIRIEDDILITDGQPLILSKALPRTTDEIEKIMQKEFR